MNQRLAAHRTRHIENQDEAARQAEEPKWASRRAAEAAARVAARYAKAPSYSQLFADDALASAEASSAVAATQSTEVEQLAPSTSQTAEAHANPVQHPVPSEATAAASPAIDLQEAAPPPTEDELWSEMRTHRESNTEHLDSYEDAHRGTTHESGIELVQPIPANLIEFPREIVATRRARPRLSDSNPQLSIFEVDPESIEAHHELSDRASGTIAPPEWATIELAHLPESLTALHQHPVETREPEYLSQARTSRATSQFSSSAAASAIESHLETYPDASAKFEPMAAANSATALKEMGEFAVAPITDRLLAAVVDGALVTLAFLAAAMILIGSAAHLPAGRAAMIAAGCGWPLCALLYQFLFLCYAEGGTLGMRYARIALCTFEDANPTRRQMFKRIPATLLSALPAGFGYLWALVDGDHLGWHDHISRTYQRKY